MRHKKASALCAYLCILFFLASTTSGMAENAHGWLEPAEPVRGVLTYPETVDEQQAAYIFRYEYPQFIAITEADKAINAYYIAICDDLRRLAISDRMETPQEEPAEGRPALYTDIGYQITTITDDYVSIVLTNRKFLGYTESETLTANVFARSGIYAGQTVSLSQVMGLEQDGDEFSIEASFASKLVYKLVWRIIEEQRASMEKDYFEGLTRHDLETVFSPEMDFYLDADENLVFYVQTGAIAGEVEGMLTFPFAMAELLTAVRE